MSDFLSKYTGQEIETLLGQVEEKVNKTDITAAFTNDDTVPGAASLSFKLKSRLDDLDTSLGTNYMRIDGQTQTVNGAKTFVAPITAQGGIQVPTGRSVTITDEPTLPSHAVNLSFMRKHGVSEDTAPITSGLSIQTLGTGYNSLKLDLSRLTAYAGSTPPISFAVLVSGNLTQSWTINALLDLIFNSNRLTNNYVSANSYASDMLVVNQAIDDRVTTQTFTQFQQANNLVLATKQDLAKTSSTSVPAAGNVNLADLDKVNCLSMLVTATWGSIIDVYRFTFGSDGTVKTEILIQKSTAGVLTATGSIVSNKLRVNFANANASVAAAVDYKITASF